MLDLLNNLNVLNHIQFAAVSLDRIPKYGSNEINVCSVIDKQSHMDTELNELKNQLQDVSIRHNNANASDRANETKMKLRN